MSKTLPPSIIISDASCLILLTNIGRLHLLGDLFGECLITPVIAAEFGELLPDWVRVLAPRSELPAKLLTQHHHAGERSALALALETPGSFLILDDAPARQLASQLQLPFTGTLGVLAQAKKKGLLPLLRPVLMQLRDAGMWVAPDLLERVCREAGE